MKDRIMKNEERLDNIIETIKDVNKSLDEFDSIDEDLKELNKYYGSKSWLNDLKKYDEGNFKNIKAGVLSEDAVWNTLEDLNDLIDRMNFICSKYEVK